MIDQALNYCKEYFPATLGAIIGVWKKRKTSEVFDEIKSLTFIDVFTKLKITIIALFAIIVGICLGKWVSSALIGYYEIENNYLPPLIEFVTALNGIKIIDTLVKSTEKSLDIVSDKLPKIVSDVLDSVSQKIKSFFK